MASNTVEQIFVELLLNAKGYNKDADQAIKKSESLEGGLKDVEKQSKTTGQNLDGLTKGLGKVIKGIAGMATVIAAGTGLLKLAEEARKANEELNFLSQNLGMSSQNVKAWQGAAAAMGGSAQGMAGDMKSLNSAMNDFKMTGESSMLPMFNTLGVSMVDAQGKVRDTDKVMLDLADSMSRMNREEAVLMGQKLGFDEGTVNALVQGRDAMKEMVDYHKQMYSSSKEELAASRQLSENQAKLGAHWASMKLMIGNAIVPLLIKMSNIALKFFEFLQRHQKTVKNVFQGLGIFLGMLVVPLLGKALLALTAFIAPFAPFLLVVGALGAAFIALYDDYKTWAEGGNSLFNWGAFSDYINNAKFSVDNLKNGFAYLLTGYTSWAQAAEGGREWLKLKGFIDENGVSVNSLLNGFRNLSDELIQSAIPTLKGYGSILNKLFSGDFKGAIAEANEMGLEFGKRVAEGARSAWDRITGAADVATGQPIGTLGSTSIMNNSQSNSPNYVAKSGSGKKNEFVKKYLPVAQEVSKRLNVPVDALLSQWALETGWGGSITKGTGYNLGNIKAGSSWKGKSVRAYDKAEKSNDLYRVYNTPQEFADDYVNLISKNKRYKDALGAQDSKQYFEALKRGGYATDPDYVRSGVNTSKSIRNELATVGATQAQATMPTNQIPKTIAKPSNTKTTNVDVKINEVKVQSTASTITGVVGDAMKAAQNSFYQLVGSMN